LSIPCTENRRTGIQQHDIAFASVNGTIKNVAKDFRIFESITALQLRRVGQNAIEVVFREKVIRSGSTFDQFRNPVGGGYGQFIHAIIAVNDHCPTTTKLSQSVGKHFGQLRSIHTEQHTTRSRRIGQRTKQIEKRSYSKTFS
jgi:hypothetical protein